VSAPLRKYSFATAAQWQLGLFHLATPGAGLQPLRPFARKPQRFPSAGGFAPTVLLTREILWRDNTGGIHLLSPHDDSGDPFMAPSPIAHSSRLIANSCGIWAMGAHPGSLYCYEPGTFTELVSVELTGFRLVDLAYLDCSSVGVLAHNAGGWHILSIDCEGRIVADAPLACLHHPIGCTYLRGSRQLVVLTGGEHPCLFWYTLEGGAPKQTLAVALRYPCCECFYIAGSDRIYVAAASDGQDAVVVLGPDGALADKVPVEAAETPITGLAPAGTSLYLTGARGLLRFSIADQVPSDSGEINCTYLSPAMHSPDPEGSTCWLRTDCRATLPEGCSIEIAAAATSDTEIRDRINKIAVDTHLSPDERIDQILGQENIWQPRTVFHGDAPAPKAKPDTETFSAPLFNITGRFLWIAITLRASSESAFPAVSEFSVSYPGHGLMEYLPALYRFESLGGQRNPVRNDGFGRALVGVLEATTQEIDKEIGSLGANIHPDTAPEAWLNYVARWLSLPWDDALNIDQKHALVNHAAELTRLRGTRAGLELLLQCLFPGTPARFRVTDTTADFGFAVLDCDASLPAILAGYSRGRAELGSHAVLGRIRLPCPDQPDDPTARWLSKVRVDIAATATEKSAWEPWLRALLSTYLPATVSTVLHWTSLHALRSGTPVLDDSLVFESAPAPHLGSDAVTGLARFPDSKPRLSPTGLPMGTRLR
jgi:phage tail-like protein